MALQANAVDARAVGLDELDDAGCALGLVGTVLEVVVVVEEAGIRVGSLGILEGDRNIRLADGLEEDVVAVGTVFVECCRI